MEKILRAAAVRPSLRVVSDEVGSPTHTLDLAHATLNLVHTEAYGIYHVVNTGACSRFEQAMEILRLAGLDTEIGPCSAKEYPAKAPRPAYSVLDSARYSETTGCVLRSWREALSEYMQRREVLA